MNDIDLLDLIQLLAGPAAHDLHWATTPDGELTFWFDMSGWFQAPNFPERDTPDYEPVTAADLPLLRACKIDLYGKETGFIEYDLCVLYTARRRNTPPTGNPFLDTTPSAIKALYTPEGITASRARLGIE